jgi:hypothetical protein
MEVLFQIGKDLAALQARVDAIESSKCSCKSKGRSLKDSELPKERLAELKQLRAKHAQLFAGFNKVLKDLKLPAGLAVGRITLMDKGKLVGEDDEDICCICCLDGSGGYEYCCDYAGCSCCD